MATIHSPKTARNAAPDHFVAQPAPSSTPATMIHGRLHMAAPKRRGRPASARTVRAGEPRRSSSSAPAPASTSTARMPSSSAVRLITIAKPSIAIQKPASDANATERSMPRATA